MFSLPTDVHYLNCAYMSPLLKSVEEAGIRGIQRKRFPIDILPSDYFTEVQEVRELFGKLINVSALIQQLKVRISAGTLEKHFTKSTKVKLFNEQRVAVVQGIYTIEKPQNKGIVVLTMRYSDVYAKEQNQWTLISSQFSRIRNSKI